MKIKIKNYLAQRYYILSLQQLIQKQLLLVIMNVLETITNKTRASKRELFVGPFHKTFIFVIFLVTKLSIGQFV